MLTKVYVGCSLLHASEESKKEINDFKDRLRTVNSIEVLDFLGQGVGTAEDVYKHDIHNCVMKADLFVAECSYPSLGLGWELGTAVEKKGIHVLAVARKDAKVSRVVLGAECDLNPLFSFKTYTDADELFAIFSEKLKEIQNTKQ